MLLTGCKLVPISQHRAYSQFIGVTDLSKFSITTNELGEQALLSPVIKTRSAWNELVLSWNVAPQAGTRIHVEAGAMVSGRMTKFYSLGSWSLDQAQRTSASSSKQADADGAVQADTLSLTAPSSTANFCQKRFSGDEWVVTSRATTRRRYPAAGLVGRRIL